MQANFLIIPTALLRLYTAKKALFLSYLVAVYKAVKKADNLKNGAFYCCVNAASAATTAQATTQRELLQELQDKGLLSVTYEGANGKRYIKFQPKMQAEFPLLFCPSCTENEHHDTQKTSPSCAENEHRDARKTSPNNINIKYNNKSANALFARADFSKKTNRLGGLETSPTPTEQEDALSKKSCAKKRFSEMQPKEQLAVEARIWERFLAFLGQQGRPASKYTSQKAKDACRAIVEFLEQHLSERGKSSDSDNVLACWDWQLQMLDYGKGIDGKLSKAKAAAQKDAAYYCQLAETVQLFASQIGKICALCVQLHTFQVKGDNNAPKAPKTSKEGNVEQQPKAETEKNAPNRLLNFDTSKIQQAKPLPKLQATSALATESQTDWVMQPTNLLLQTLVQSCAGITGSVERQMAMLPLLQEVGSEQMKSAIAAFISAQSPANQNKFKKRCNMPSFDVKQQIMYLAQLCCNL